MKMVYPVIFTEAKDCILIEVPDLQIFTEGASLIDAIDMARDAICLKGISIEDTGKPIPKAAPTESIDASKGKFAAEGKSIVSLVDVDFEGYKRKNDNRMVRRNITLPNWMDLAAEKEGLNVSRIAQEALNQRLDTRKISMR